MRFLQIYVKYFFKIIFTSSKYILITKDLENRGKDQQKNWIPYNPIIQNNYYRHFDA